MEERRRGAGRDMNNLIVHNPVGYSTVWHWFFEILVRHQILTCTNACSGHTHVAEALKLPIHIFFTMPWT